MGYRVVDGALQKGAAVTLEAAPDSYPSYFNEVLNKDDAIQRVVFEDADQQSVGSQRKSDEISRR